MKLTLLQMVTSIMSDMDSDAITSISDTPESLQVASIVQDVYFQLLTNIEVPELEQLLQLTTVGVANPNFLMLPTNVQQIKWVMYDKIRQGDVDKAVQKVLYLTPEDFMMLTTMRKSSQSNIVSVADPNSGVNLLIQNDIPPTYWTSFDDNYLCFDAYDSAVDTNGLVGTKSFSWGQIVPVFTQADGFVPTLDDNLFPLLLAEAKSTAFAAIKQTMNPKIEKQSRFQRISTVNDRHRTKSSQQSASNNEIAGPNFGRRSNGWKW